MTKKFIALFIALVMLAVPFSTLVNAEEAAPFAVRINEAESNDTFATAQTIYSDYTVSGSFASQSDVDIYKITATIDGLANFHLGNIPTDNDYDLELYDADGELLAIGTASYDFEQIMAQSVSVGDVFYILIRCFQMYNTEDVAYTLRVRVYPLTYTYYSQILTDPSASQLENLEYITSAGSSTNWATLYQAEGCVVASAAMILKNMKAETVNEIPDMLTANGNSITARRFDGNPYGVMYANMYSPSFSFTGNGYTANYTLGGGSPTECDYNAIAATYGVRSFVYEPGYGEEIEMVANLLTVCPQGILLYFDSNLSAPGGDTHGIVCTATTVEATLSPDVILSQYTPLANDSATYKGTAVANEELQDYTLTRSANAIDVMEDADKFTVYDPYYNTAYGIDSGDGVLLSESYADYKFDWDQLYRIIVFY